MAADVEESRTNENTGADALAFASEILGGGYITDEEGASPKENILMAIVALA